MRKVKTLLSLMAILLFHAGAFALIPLTTATEEGVKVQGQSVNGSNDVNLSRQQIEFFANLSVKDYEALKSKKLNFFERLAFKTSQHRLKQMLKKDDGNVNTLSKISWFAKGLLFGPLALLLGYLFLKDDDRELIKWIWFGTIGFVLIAALVVIVLLQEK